MPTVTTREYNPTSGRLIGNVSELDWGNVPLGSASGVKVVDMSVEDVDAISNVRVQIIASDLVPVNPSPTDIQADGSAGNGNFGAMHGTEFVARSTLTRFFAGLLAPVTVGTRSSKVSEYVYMNVKMNVSAAGAGTVSYQWLFDYI